MHHLTMKAGALLLVALLPAVLSACTGTGARHLSVVTGPVGGTMYAISGAWADVVNSTIPEIQMTNQVAGGTVHTARVLGNKEADFAMVSNDNSYYAYKGENLFQGNAHPEFRGIAALYAESFHVVVRKNSGIAEIEDLAGRRTAVGPPGSGTLLNSQRVLEAHGLTFDNVGAMRLGFVESAEYLKDGHCDGAFYLTGVPYGPVADITVTQDIDVIGLSEKVVDILTDGYPFLVPAILPAGLYKGMDQPIRTVSVKMLLLTTEQMDGDTVYEVTKALFENLDRIAAAHVTAKSVTLAGAVEGIPLPLHPGAERYYREQGVIDDRS